MVFPRVSFPLGLNNIGLNVGWCSKLLKIALMSLVSNMYTFTWVGYCYLHSHVTFHVSIHLQVWLPYYAEINCPYPVNKLWIITNKITNESNYLSFDKSSYLQWEVLRPQHFYYIFTTNYGQLIVIGSNLNLTLRLLF